MKKKYEETLTLNAASLEGNICITVASKVGSQHLNNPQSLFRFHVLPAGVCVCVVLSNFIVC